MLNKTITALSLAIVLTSASAAMAAPKHTTYHRPPPSAEEQVPAAEHGKYCSNPGDRPGFGTEPNYMAIQDEDECVSN
jgi:hypothetical protein